MSVTRPIPVTRHAAWHQLEPDSMVVSVHSDLDYAKWLSLMGIMVPTTRASGHWKVAIRTRSDTELCLMCLKRKKDKDIKSSP